MVVDHAHSLDSAIINVKEPFFTDRGNRVNIVHAEAANFITDFKSVFELSGGHHIIFHR